MSFDPTEWNGFCLRAFLSLNHGSGAYTYVALPITHIFPVTTSATVLRLRYESVGLHNESKESWLFHNDYAVS